MLTKPVVSFESFPLNPWILELWSWVGENISSLKFLGGRAMDYNPEQLNLKLSFMKL